MLEYSIKIFQVGVKERLCKYRLDPQNLQLHSRACAIIARICPGHVMAVEQLDD